MTERTREKISLNDTSMDVIVKMAEGNPGAVDAVIALMKRAPDGFMDVMHLDDMGMRGPQIHVAYKEHCQGDIDAFSKAIRNRDEAMVEFVNAHPGVGDSPQAVRAGASFK